MAFQHDDLTVSHQLIVGEGFPPFLGIGPAKIRGSSYIEGPAVIGDATAFPNIAATLMVGPNKNVDSTTPVTPGALCGANFSPYSLAVAGDAVIFDNMSIVLFLEEILLLKEMFFPIVEGMFFLIKRILILNTHLKKVGV
jgi:hypothetical protein